MSSMSVDPRALSWNKLSGSAHDIGVGADGSVWVIGTGSLPPGGFGIFYWDASTSNWLQVDGAAEQIAVGPHGHPWVVNTAREIYTLR